VPALGQWRDRSTHVAACHMETAGSGHSLAPAADAMQPRAA
jgi:peptide/nickel transport system ATP-binding protein